MLRHCVAAAGIMLSLFPAAASAQGDPHHGSEGFRVEGLLGYDSASFDSVRNGEGLLYGVGVGYDLGSGRMRFGLEAEASDSTAKDCEQFAFAGTNSCSKMGRDLYVGVRVGGLISSNVLLYAKGGYTNIRESGRFTPTGGGADVITHPEFDGFRLGAGTEIAIGAKSYVKAEYRYSVYEESQSFDRHQGVIGFGFRF